MNRMNNRSGMAITIANKVNLAPCFGCATRSAGCHSNCKAYAEYRANYSKTKDEVYTTLRAENLADDYTVAEKIKSARFYNKIKGKGVWRK